MSDDKFSVGLRLNDLDDFITPSQTCVVPTGPSNQKKPSADEKRAKIELTEDGYVEVDSSGKKSALQAAEISLADCLACSGCITSAESILVTAQSTDRLKELLAAHPDRSESPLIFTLAPQSLAALSVHVKKSLAETLDFVASQLHASLGAAAVIDASIFSALSAKATADEFLAEAPPKPLLSGECPGWVCYAEKTHPEALPQIAKTRSAQALAGSFVRSFYGPSALHVAVMPCYDKKLEAARSDFANPESGAREVDLVLATQELISLLPEFVPPDPASSALALTAASSPRMTDQLAAILVGRRVGISGPAASESLWGPHRRGSGTAAAGGVFDCVMRRAVKAKFGAELEDESRVEVRKLRGRNADMREWVVTDKSSGKILRFAAAYGFRNIQNVVRKVKAGNCLYDYIEIMACPHACINGGGQPRTDKGGMGLSEVRDAHESREFVEPEVWEEEFRKALPSGFSFEEKTEYHSRKSDKPANALQIKW